MKPFVYLTRASKQLYSAYNNIVRYSLRSGNPSKDLPFISRCQLSVSEVYVAMLNLLKSYENENPSSSSDGQKSND